MKFFFNILIITLLVSVVNATVELPRPQKTLLNLLLDYFKSTANGYNQKDTILMPEYDFIVIGSGPGGSTVASRLSEISEWRVLLLEAGEQESLLSEIPGLAPVLSLTNYNWKFFTEKQPGFCKGLKNGQCTWPQGKALGGTSSTNAMVYTRGHKLDYDHWESLGNDGWGYKDILKYFKKSENVKNLKLRNQPYRGTKGPVAVRLGRIKTKILDAFFEAGREIDFPILPDYNDGNVGNQFSRVQCMIDGHVRASAAKAYLKPAKDRVNLDISTQSLVLRVLVDPKSKKAYGVEVFKDGKHHKIFAKKEVIVSAGALQTPKLLMLSGVGPKQHLEKMGVNVIQDLPGVGENLQGHPGFPFLTFSVNQTNIVDTKDPAAPLEYIFAGSGPLAETSVNAFVFIRTEYNHPKHDPRPDMEIIFHSGSVVTDKGKFASGKFGITDKTYKELFERFETMNTFSMLPNVFKTKSRGSVKLKSANPFDCPIFHANYFDDERDLYTLVEGIKFAIKLTKTKAFQKYGTKVNILDIKGCKEHFPGSDDYWKCAVRYFTTPLHHQSGTCKMGPKDDVFSVVSPELKVHGIKNLRVIDASIMPVTPGAHTGAPTYMIGEKGSDMIKVSWGKKL